MTYIVEASDDLKTWTSVGTVTLIGDSMPFVDASAGSLERRFYRVRLSP